LEEHTLGQAIAPLVREGALEDHISARRLAVLGHQIVGAIRVVHWIDRVGADEHVDTESAIPFGAQALELGGLDFDIAAATDAVRRDDLVVGDLAMNRADLAIANPPATVAMQPIEIDLPPILQLRRVRFNRDRDEIETQRAPPSGAARRTSPQLHGPPSMSGHGPSEATTHPSAVLNPFRP